ncbi:MAG: hypothetical protein ACTTIS_00835 [Streptobacillus sp.]
MSYGVITPKFNSTENNTMMIIHHSMSNHKTVVGVSDTLRRKQFHIVHNSRNIGKVYGTRENSLYVCKDNINIYIAGPAHTYYNNDIFTTYNKDIAIDSSIKYGLETADRPISTFFSTRSRYIRIIDQIYVSTIYGGLTNCNFKFSYVRKIGVALPATIRGDLSDNYPDNYSMVFNIFNNTFQSIFYNNLARETTVTRPFEIHDKQVSNGEAIFGSPAYIFDLSSL